MHIDDLAHAFQMRHRLRAVDHAAARGDHRAFNIQRKHCRLLRPFKFRSAFFIDDLLQAFVLHALYEQIRIKKIL